MPPAADETPVPKQSSPTQVGEWFWRFLAVVMLVIVGWVVWIAIQISPPDLILPAAFEAAAQGRATRNSGGAIGGVAPQPVAAAVEAPAVPAAPPPPPAEPPVNLDKLRLAESIETPIFERPRRAARPAPDAAQ
ncbi:MAG: hypothetical protein JSS40_12480 [Proteobacteria bacterium]|nr:hypothetical protein [Pseudomonadota bacterium]